jgi:hypothetical protein
LPPHWTKTNASIKIVKIANLFIIIFLLQSYLSPNKIIYDQNHINRTISKK